MKQIKRIIRDKKGMTLMEMMIVVAIVGILSSIAFASISSYRDKAQTYLCIANLRQLDSLVSLWAIDNTKSGNEPVEMSNLVPVYIRATPYCPLDSAKEGYVLTTVVEKPKCPKDPTQHHIN